MIVSKRDTGDIYDGCLNYLKEDLSADFSNGVSWVGEGIKGLVGSPSQYNTHNTGGSVPYLSLTILLGERFIFPVAYSLMRRRDPSYDGHYLKGWNFSGRNKYGIWKKLSSYSNKPFTFGEKRTFLIDAKESYDAFMLQMTETDTNEKWYICLGQIEVFGDIYPTSKFNYNRMKCTSRAGYMQSNIYLFFVLACCF